MPACSARLRPVPVLLAVAVACLRPGPAWSQQPPAPPPTFELPEIEVAGKRPQLPSTTPASVSVITAAEIAAMGALTVADALRVLPEVLVKGSGGPGALTTVSIRGSFSTQVLILLDGVPLNRPDQPSVDLSTLPIQVVDHIEVLRGPFSALYGSATLGGVVNIVTRSVPVTQVFARAGSYGESSSAATLGGEIGALTYLLQGIETGSTGFAPDTDYTNATQLAKLHWATGDDAGVTLTATRLWHVTGTPGPLPFQDLLSRLWEGRTLVDLAWRRGHPGGPGASLRVYTLDDDVSFASPALAFQSEDVAHLWGVQGQIVLAPSPRHLVTAGVEYQGQTVSHSDTSPAAFSALGHDLGAYLEDDWQIGPAVLLSAGIRGDSFAQFGTQVNPRVGLLVLLSDRLALRAAVGRAFRAPSFDELSPALFGNPALQPETAWSGDLGLDYALGPGLTLTLTGYYKDATDLIVSPPPLFIPQNVGHAIVSGASLELRGQLSPQWFVRANVTGQRAYDASTGLDVIYVPRSLGALEVVYDAGPRVTLGAVVSYVGDRFADAANAQVVPGYWLTSVTATWTFPEGWQVQAGVANLFDVSYQESLGFPEPGRRYFATATKTF